MANFNKIIQKMRHKRMLTSKSKSILHRHFAFFFTGSYKRSINIIAEGKINSPLHRNQYTQKLMQQRRYHLFLKKNNILICWKM